MARKRLSRLYRDVVRKVRVERRVHTRRGGDSFTFSSLLAERMLVSSLALTGLTCSVQTQMSPIVFKSTY